MNWRIGVLAPALALCGCGGSGGGILPNQPILRAFNAVNGTTNVTVILKDQSGNALNTTPAAALGVYSRRPNAVIPNENATGTIVSSGTPIYTSPATLYRANDEYTLVAGGTQATPYLMVLNDNQGGQEFGHIGFRAVHAGSNQASVDVYLLPGVPASVSGNPAFFSLGSEVIGSSSNAETGTTDGDGYETERVPVTSTYTVLVTPHGSTSVIANASVTLFPGTYYTAIVYDSGGNTAVSMASDQF